MKYRYLACAFLFSAVAAAGACAATDDNNTSSGNNGATTNGSGGAGGSGGENGSGGSGEGGIDFTGVGGGAGGNGPPCDLSMPDADNDGFTEEMGDCNDCDANVNPAAIEVPTDPMDPNAIPVDENCNDETDEPIPTCDDAVLITSPDPRDAARAMEMCNDASPDGLDYGVLSASWTHADGSPAGASQLLQFGLHTSFGPNVAVQKGSKMALLSSGFARLPGQADAATNHSASAQGFNPLTPPTGFPQNVPGCDGGTDIFDDIGLQVQLRAPSNATGFRYSFKFHSFEFAEYVCTNFNDQFIAIVNPAPMGAINGNISFDSANNPVSVNIAFFDVCDPMATDFAQFCNGAMCPTQPNPYCPLGVAELMGTGFDTGFGGGEDAGATSWLQTTAPMGAGEVFSIRFAIWDTGDNAWDSSVLLDGFEWLATPGTSVITQPPVN